MENTPDLVVEIFYIQQNAFWRLSNEELLDKLDEKNIELNATEVANAALTARELYELAQISFHAASSPSAAAELAVQFIKSKLPGLSDRAYSAAAHIAMRNWIM
jgi:hypothetical protein